MVQNDKPIVKFLNIMVLLSSILVLVLFLSNYYLQQRFYPNALF